VDDNPSIHRIAESLLAPTDVELVCVASAAEALDRIGQGDRFDVALVDTAMPGMDGWTLLDRLRGMEETVRMPIALMAGVLDPVDPARLAGASIQGFLKKPIELRELGDRVKALLATPVVVSPSPFSTVPSTPSKDLLKHAHEAFPELRPEHADVPTGLLDIDLDLPEPEDDLLLLTAEDLWPEDPLPATPEPTLGVSEQPDVHLELEELDLDNLQDLAMEPMLERDQPAEPLTEPSVALAAERAFPEDAPFPSPSEMEELETVPTDFSEPASGPVPDAALAPELPLADLAEVAPLLGVEGAGVAELVEQVSLAAVEEPVPVIQGTPDHPEPEVLADGPAADGQVAAAASHDTPGPTGQTTVSPEQAGALLQALLAEPVLMDVLVKALVARLGDQVLREIAWEVMPDLAGRLQR
jgi:CheY-like chemotaxis protein